MKPDMLQKLLEVIDGTMTLRGSWDENGRLQGFSITFDEDKSTGFLYWHENASQWVWSEAYQTDAATQTGMYDR